MSYELKPFKAWHLEWLASRGPALGGGISPDEEIGHNLERTFSFTTLLDGEPVASGGLIQVWPHRHAAWSYINVLSAGHMYAITKHALWIFAQKKGRLEMSVRQDFEQGHEWARLVGFSIETPALVLYGSERETHVGYVRFN